jgi:predicted phage-related endonuclease
MREGANVFEEIAITDPEQWQTLRRQDVTASVIGALFGAHPYLTIGQLFAEKKQLSSAPIIENAAMRRGTRLENVVAEEVARMHPDWIVSKADSYFRDPILRLGATPDYFLADPQRPNQRGILQIKTAGASAFKRHWAEGPPLWIVLQVAVEMHLTGASWGLVAVMPISEWSDFAVETFDIERHSGAIDRIIEGVQNFWQAFDRDEVPQIDYARDESLIRLLYPISKTGTTVDLSHDNRMQQLLPEIRNLRQTLKETQSLLTALENEVKAKIGDAERAIIPGWSVTLKSQTRKAHTVKESTFRRLNIKAIGDDDDADDV